MSPRHASAAGVLAGFVLGIAAALPTGDAYVKLTLCLGGLVLLATLATAVRGGGR